jgi:hypothetical protein
MIANPNPIDTRQPATWNSNVAPEFFGGPVELLEATAEFVAAVCVSRFPVTVVVGVYLTPAKFVQDVNRAVAVPVIWPRVISPVGVK